MYAFIEKETHEGRWEKEAITLAQKFADDSGTRHGVRFSMGNRAAGMMPRFVVSPVSDDERNADNEFNCGIFDPIND